MISEKKRYYKRVTKTYTAYRFIDGVWREVDPVGFCICNTHKGFLSTDLLKKHQCLRKQCCFLKRYESHPYWNRRVEIAKLRKERKDRFK